MADIHALLELLAMHKEAGVGALIQRVFKRGFAEGALAASTKGLEMGATMARHADAVKLKEWVLPAAAAAIVGAPIGERAARYVHSAATKEKNLQQAVEFDPEVKRLYKADPAAVQARFNTLHKFNPRASSDPLITSGWIRQSSELPFVSVNALGELSKAPAPTQLMSDKLVERALATATGSVVGQGLPDLLTETA